jgi:hypothetical protein
MVLERESLLPLDDLTVGLIVSGVILACVIVIFAMRRRGKKEAKKISQGEKPETEFRGLPFKISKSVPSEEATHAKEELRILDLEREILGDAIRRLYEAHAEGKITEQERERLAETYKSRMMTVKEATSKNESLVALHELEAMQEDLVKLFSERFGELSTKVEELRSKVETKPIKEIEIPTAQTPQAAESEEKPAGEKSKRKRKAPQAKPSPRTEAEKRIEEIRAEVEKVLDRLGQMEIES